MLIRRKREWKQLWMYYLVYSLLLLLVLLFAVGRSVSSGVSDYWLTQSRKESGQVLARERFISQFDCRDRGMKNVELLWAVGIRSYFTCSIEDQRDAKEDTSVRKLPQLDDRPVLRISPERAAREVQ